MAVSVKVQYDYEWDICISDAMAKIQKSVQDLYEYRDTYFQSQVITDGAKKGREARDEVIQSEVLKSIKDIDEQLELLDKGEMKQRSFILFYKAKLLDVLPPYNSEVEDILTTHVKRNPSHNEAWNILGECFFKKGDLTKAAHSFQASLRVRKNVVALRNLSMVIRQQAGCSPEGKTMVEKGIEMAREAVNMNISDGISWSILGNAYTSYYFKVNPDPSVLKKALQAYNQAAQLPEVTHDGDFHFNRGVAFHYEQDFKNALECFERACICDPTWEDAKQQLSSLLEFLTSVMTSIEKKGSLPHRRLRKFMQGFSKSLLGPYEDGYIRKYDSKCQYVPLTLTMLSSLNVGHNTGKVVLGKVVCQVFSACPISFTFCIIDEEETCMAVNVLNLAAGKGVVIGDSVAIPEPLIELKDFTFKEKQYNFKWALVVDPLVLVVNGKSPKADWKATPVCNMVLKPD